MKIGGNARTNGETTWLRDFEEGSDWYVIAKGELGHETAGHERHSDFEVVKQAALAGSAIRMSLLNRIEDPRVERAGAREFPGISKWIAATVRHYANQGWFLSPKADDHPADILSMYCLLRGRCVLPFQDFLIPEADKAAAVFEKIFGTGPLVKLDALLSRAPTLTSTADALDLTDAILTMLKEEQEKKEQERKQTGQAAPPSSQEDGDDEHEPDDGQPGDRAEDDSQSDDQGDDSAESGGQGDGADDQDSAGDGAEAEDDTSGDQDPAGKIGAGLEDGDDEHEPDDGQPGDRAEDDSQSDDQGDDSAESGGQGDGADDQDSAGDSAEAEDDTSGDQDPAGKNGAGPTADDIANAIASALSASADDINQTDVFDAAKKELSQAAQSHDRAGQDPVLPRVVLPRDQNQTAGIDRAARVGRTVGKIRGQLQSLVEASKEDDWSYRSQGSRINPRLIGRLKTGDTRIFLTTHQHVAPNTAIQLLVDQSGSMAATANNGQSRQDVALDAAMSLSIALKALPDVSIGVTAFCSDHNYNAQVTVLQKHGEDVRRVAGRFALYPSGGTPMTEGLLHAAYELIDRREERKQIYVVTDGDPDSRPDVMKLVERITASGIEVIGIGIETTAVEGLFPQFVVINDVTDLEKTLFKLARRSLSAA